MQTAEFNREETIIIEAFLDLYCHDCKDKECTETGKSCRMTDVFAYLDDMGTPEEE